MCKYKAYLCNLRAKVHCEYMFSYIESQKGDDVRCKEW